MRYMYCEMKWTYLKVSKRYAHISMLQNWKSLFAGCSSRNAWGSPGEQRGELHFLLGALANQKEVTMATGSLPSWLAVQAKSEHVLATWAWESTARNIATSTARFGWTFQPVHFPGDDRVLSVIVQYHTAAEVGGTIGFQTPGPGHDATFEEIRTSGQSRWKLSLLLFYQTCWLWHRPGQIE